MRSPNPNIREAAIERLASQVPREDGLAPKEVTALLASALNDRRFQVRARAAMALGGRHSPDLALPALQKALKECPQHVDAARKAIESGPRKPGKDISPAEGGDPDNDLKVYVTAYVLGLCEAISSYRDPRALEALVLALDPGKAGGSSVVLVVSATAATAKLGIAPAWKHLAAWLPRFQAAAKSAKPHDKAGGANTLATMNLRLLLPIEPKTIEVVCEGIGKAAASQSFEERPATPDPDAWVACIGRNLPKLAASF